jgi:hypothetical protein
MQLLTARMPAKDVAALKKQLLRPGFVEEWNSLDALAAGFGKILLAKDNQVPSAGYKLFTSYDPEAVLWLGFTTKDAAVKERYNLFLKVWPETRQRIPHALMQEMRIKPELSNYNEIVQLVFLELIDGKLTTPEEMRAFLEPYSPPAPPPQVTIKRTRGKRGEAKVKDFDEDEESEEGGEGDEEIDDMGGDEDDIGLGIDLPKVDLEPDLGEEGEESGADAEEEEDEDEEEEPAAAKRGAKSGKGAPRAEAPSGKAAAKTALKSHKLEPTKHEAETRHPAKAASATKNGAEKSDAHHAKSAAHGPVKSNPDAKAKPAAPAKKAAPPSHPHKPAPAKHEVKKPVAKTAAKHAPPVKSHGAHAAPSKHAAPAKAHKPAKPAPKKPAGKKH